MIIRFNRHSPECMPQLRLTEDWWVVRTGFCPAKVLSDFGFMAYANGKPILSSFLYPVLGGELCLWGFQVSNPESTHDERTIALEETATAVSDFAKNLGYKMLVSYPGHGAITKRLEALGFALGDETVCQAFKEL